MLRVEGRIKTGGVRPACASEHPADAARSGSGLLSVPAFLQIINRRFRFLFYCTSNSTRRRSNSGDRVYLLFGRVLFHLETTDRYSTYRYYRQSKKSRTPGAKEDLTYQPVLFPKCATRRRNVFLVFLVAAVGIPDGILRSKTFSFRLRCSYHMPCNTRILLSKLLSPPTSGVYLLGTCKKTAATCGCGRCICE